MSTPGLVFIRSRISSEALTDDVFNNYYTKYHLPDFISSGIADLALLYKNLDPSKKWQYLALYRGPDVNFQSDPEKMKHIPLHHETLPNGGSVRDFIEMDSKKFQPIQVFEGPEEKVGRGKVLFIAEYEPAEGTNDEALSDFYDRQHFDILSMFHQYRRSTRYKTIDGSKPRFVALHEFDSTDLDPYMRKTMMATKWMKEIISSAQIFESSAWELISEQGNIEEKL